MVLARGSNTEEEPVGTHADEGTSVEEDERGRLMGSPSIANRRKWGLDAFLRLDLALGFLVSHTA